MSRSKPSNDLGNGVRPHTALGVKDPIWRLGALVSLPLSVGKVILVPKPDRSLSLKDNPLHATSRGNVSSQSRSRPRKHHDTPQPKESRTPPPSDQGGTVLRALKANWNVKVFDGCRFSCLDRRGLEKTIRLGHIRNGTDEPEGTNQGVGPWSPRVQIQEASPITSAQK